MTRPADRPHLQLLVHHFGPTGHTGGFRWWRLVRGLTEAHGWTADVVTSTAPVDAEPPDGVRVEQVPTWSLSDRVRRTVAPRLDAPARAGSSIDPDQLTDPSQPWPGRWDATGSLLDDALHVPVLGADAVWAARAAAAGRALRRPDVVVASQPLEPVVWAGAHVARHHGVPFVADHRHVLGAGRTHWRSRVERGWFRTIDRRAQSGSALAIDIACTATEELSRRQPEVPRAFVPSGWDPADEVDATIDRDCFRVTHAGWLHPFLDPRPWLRGLAGLLDRRPAARASLRVELLGGPTHVAGVDLQALAEAHGLPAGSWHRTERLPKGRAMRRAGRAAVLVAQEFPDGLQAPSKLYDYAVLPGELLLVGRPDGSMARDAALLGVRTLQRPTEITDLLVTAFDRWRDGRSFTRNDPAGRLAAARSVADLDVLLRASTAGDAADVRAAAATAGAPRPPVAAALAAAADGAAS